MGLCALAFGCARGPEGAAGAVTQALTTEVPLFSSEYIYYDQETPHTTAEVPVELPSQGPYRKVTLELKLSCPENACDHWDRPGEFYFQDENGNKVEFARFMTPYRRGGTWQVDVTDLQTLLAGQRTIKVFIMTFVGPRINTQYGKGWLVDAKLIYEAGEPARTPIAAIPIPWADITYGDPLQPTTRSVGVEVPEGASSAGMYMLVTGHGQGNVDNCAEFCKKTHTLKIGEVEVANQIIWRDDCHLNPVSPQSGTWRLPRAGWCPGDMVRPWVADAGLVAPGSHTVSYEVQAYENTCRPDSPVCTGCTLGRTCEFDGGSHTRPRWLVSGFLVLYK
jgi:hypothetical protein